MRAQTFTDYEVLVAEDGGTDATAAVVRDAGLPVTYLPLAHSGLAARTRNAGIARARGRYIALLDDDDLWEPAKLERQMRAVAEHPDTGILCTNAWCIGGGPQRDGTRYFPEVPHDEAVHHGSVYSLLRRNYVLTSSTLIPAAFMREAGGFPEDAAFTLAQDYALWVRLACLGRVRFLDEPLIRYRFGSSGSLSDTVGYPSHRDQLLRIEADLRAFMAARGQTYRPLQFLRQMARRDRRYARELREAGRGGESWRWWLRARVWRVRALGHELAALFGRR